MFKIEELFVEANGGDLFGWPQFGKESTMLMEEPYRVNDQPRSVKLYTFCVKKNKRCGFLYLKKESMSRKVLRVTDIAFPDCQDKIHQSRLIRYDGKEPLKCELFLSDPRLRNIAQHVLEPLVQQLGYTHVAYVDMSHDVSAWYPDEDRPTLPEAKMVRNA